MRRLWATADRWGPAATAALALLGLAGYGWANDSRLSRIEGRLAGAQAQIESRIAIEVALRAETQTWQAYVVSLKEAMIRAGIREIPPPPRPVVLHKIPGRRAEVVTPRR